MEQIPLYGLILGGGRSSRMGIDKGTIVYHDRPQREFLMSLLRPFCKEVYLSCKTEADIPASLHPLADMFEIESPLNGVLSAFHKFPGVAWLTVPVDMPAIDTRIINYLLEHRDHNAVATCFYDSDGKLPEPLLCLWEAHAFPDLKEFSAEGKISPREFLRTHEVKLLQSPFPGMHVNINSMEELERYRNASKTQ
jgi:molybdenum cofactor guanylyltransferase